MRETFGLGVVDRAWIRGDTKVVQQQTPHVSCQRDGGEHFEVRSTSGRISNVHDLTRAQWHLLTFEWASTTGDEVWIGDMHGVHRANA